MRSSEDFFMCQKMGEASREFERKAAQERAQTGGSNPTYNEEKKEEVLRQVQRMQSSPLR